MTGQHGSAPSQVERLVVAAGLFVEAPEIAPGIRQGALVFQGLGAGCLGVGVAAFVARLLEGGGRLADLRLRGPQLLRPGAVQQLLQPGGRGAFRRLRRVQRLLGGVALLLLSWLYKYSTFTPP